MKRILYFFIINLLLNCSSLKYLNKFDGLNGKPKSLKKTYYSIKTNDNEKIYSITITNYDSDGRKTKDSLFRSNGSLITISTYHYDKYGNEIKQICYNNDSSVNYISSYEYNKYGQRTKMKIGSKTYNISHNKEKRISIMKGKRIDSIFESHTIEKFDKNWRNIELKSLDENNNQIFRLKKLKFDNHNNPIKYIWFDSKDQVSTIYEDRYNDNGDIIQSTGISIIKGDTITKKLNTYKYLYDTNKNKIEKKTYHFDKLFNIIRYKYEY